MRESDNPEVLVVLDTLAECKVVRDALTEITADDFQCGSQLEELRIRFQDQTRTIVDWPMYDSPGFFFDETWKEQPEFEVMPEDASFVLKASQKTLETSGISDRFLNRLTGRTQAAKQIFRTVCLANCDR